MSARTQSRTHRLMLSIIMAPLLMLSFIHSARAAGLPDNRTYEMVTPIENHDANVYIPAITGAYNLSEGIRTKRVFQASTDGNTVVYVAAPTEGGVESGGGGGDSYMGTRSPTGGWTQTSLQPFGFSGAQYQAFSPDLSLGIIDSSSEGTGSPVLPGTEAPDEGYNVLYTWTAIDGRYQSLFTKRPPDRSATEFEAHDVQENGQDAFEIAFAGSSADFSRLFFEANDALEGTGAVDGGRKENNLYESVNQHLSLVNILPNGSIQANATFGFGPQFEQPDFDNAISIDGTRAFWTDLNTNDLYLSEDVGMSDEKTLQVDASQAGGPGGNGHFLVASSDGSKVFFTDAETAGLTSDTAPGSGVNLYEYDVSPTLGQPGVLKDLTPVAEAGVEGVVGASENGEYVYFVAKGVLDNGENVDRQKAIPGADNLYMLRGDGHPVFIATLSPEDEGGVFPFTKGANNIGDWAPEVGHRTAGVSPNGESLVFMTKESLSGYPNVVQGQKIEEVYIYDATDNNLSCVSCNPNGTPPVQSPLFEELGPVGGYLPVNWSLTTPARWMSENGGRVFFDSEEPLVPADTNHRQNVYEWEREGEGSCNEANGCVYLLSGGTSASASWLEGVSASGNDVFIDTRADLVPEVQNETFKLYDVRVDGVEPVSPPACTGTGCQGLPSPPPTFATPSSVTFEGVGNFEAPTPVSTVKGRAKPLTRAQKLTKALKECHAKQSKAKRAACEVQARKRYGSSVKSKKASVHGSGGAR